MKDSITNYIVKFTPDKHMIGKNRKVTYEIYDKGSGKIIAIIKFLFHPLAENMKEFADKNKYFLIATDNFYLSIVIGNVMVVYDRGCRHCKVSPWVSWSKCQGN